VAEPLAVLESEGWRVTRVRVDSAGRADADEMAAAIEPETAMVSLIWANNETGVIQPVERVAELASQRGVLMHSEATQAVGKLDVDLRRVPIDLLSLSAHKFNGPKGVGCLVLRGGLSFEPLLYGGHQERGRRGGTEDVAGAAGLGVACELAERELPRRAVAYAQLRDRLWEGIRAGIPRVRRNGSAVHVLPNTLNIEFEGVAGEVLLQALDLEGVSVSSGAACSAGSIDPSPVLVAMGRTPEAARGSLRLSVGHGVDEAQIDRALALLPQLVGRARREAKA
jgi:cysteine desulfurase